MPLWSPGLLEPADLVRAAARLPELPFTQEYGSDPWLAISLPAGEEGMAAALHAAHSTDRATPKQIEFHTRLASVAPLKAQAGERASSTREPRLADLAKLLGERCYFSAVQKRLDAGGALGERVSVGRAMNKDIVLRHSSISKFHAYFQSTEPGTWSITDAESKNGTSVEGARLGQRESRALASGERVTFGSIETVFLDARTMWRLLRAT